MFPPHGSLSPRGLPPHGQTVQEKREGTGSAPGGLRTHGEKWNEIHLHSEVQEQTAGADDAAGWLACCADGRVLSVESNAVLRFTVTMDCLFTVHRF